VDFLKRQRFISVTGRRSAVPEGTWIRCPACEQVVYREDLADNQNVCPSCGFHMRIGARQRIQFLVDPQSFVERHAEVQPGDPLGFVVAEVGYDYGEQVKRARTKSGMDEAAMFGHARILDAPLILGVMDFSFRGGSMGSAFGERFCRAARDAVAERLPFVVICTSGGARMEEGMLALMQMAKTADAVRRLNEAGIAYISVLTNPTMGGVYASFASLGDLILAEPGATVGFAGPRLIEGALKVKLPEGFQTAEYQMEHGFIDRIVPRTRHREFLGKMVRYLTPAQ